MTQQNAISNESEKTGYEALPAEVLDLATSYDFYSAITAKMTQLVERQMTPSAGLVTQKYYNEVMSRLDLAFTGKKEGEQSEIFYGLPLIKVEHQQDMEDGFYLLVLGDKPAGAKAVRLVVDYLTEAGGVVEKREGWCFLVEWGKREKK